jgi:hypothetical protein
MINAEKSVIKKLELVIPQKDFPFKSDVITGWEYPFIFLGDDEVMKISSQNSGADNAGNIEFKEENYYYEERCCGEIEELADLCRKYKGTLVANILGEDDNIEYIRIKKGKDI